MVDTIRCQSELDLTEKFYEKLLIGAIDKRLDRTKVEAHSPTKNTPFAALTLPHRSKIAGKGKEPQRSDDETLVGSSSRWNSVHTKRSSTMQTLYEAQADNSGPLSNFQESESNKNASRRSSPPSAGPGPPFRHGTFPNEPEHRAAQRTSTFGSQKSHWWSFRD